VNTSAAKTQNSSETLLDVCIPTFNRADHLDSLLSSLSAALRFGNLGEAVRIRVSDNSSLDHTQEVLSKWRVKEPNWDLSSRNHNVGMMRNFEHLISSSSAKFTWLLGDDDELLSKDSLLHIVNALRQEDPLLIVLTSDDDARLKRGSYGGRFYNSDSFISFVSSIDPDFLRRHTWISANIFRREVFDLDYARENLDGWYMHMYGLFRGLSKTQGKILLLEAGAVQPSNSQGYREKSFPDHVEIKLEWRRYFMFLSRQFKEPSLAFFSKQWEPGVASYLRRFLRAPLKFLTHRAK